MQKELTGVPTRSYERLAAVGCGLDEGEQGAVAGGAGAGPAVQ
ncbi:hypothetical protein SBD_2040 [Streptomyces bottropensis ATCC 25435]|uniref:Uncharacterized protein n=1 Tax=Streptomyces bottropensis ATCC 25435 TaxID=1054862 RepID=M3FW69_9ACTN|nr:hypothetical protein SBD_2040 [Streptomyces bottropensis ATCC 25435]